MKIKYEPKSFEIPAEGVHWAELIEVKELGEVDTPSGMREKVRLVWKLDETDSRGRNLLSFQTFNRTLHPQSFLANAIHDIMGENAGEEFELDDLVGSRVHLVLKHHRSETNGRVYANVAAILRPKTAQEEAEEKRVADLAAKVKQAATHSPARPLSPDFVEGEITDADIPF